MGSTEERVKTFRCTVAKTIHGKRVDVEVRGHFEGPYFQSVCVDYVVADTGDIDLDDAAQAAVCRDDVIAAMDDRGGEP